MKKLLSVLAALALVATVSFAQVETPVQTTESVEKVISGPSMIFDSEVMDYGTIAHESEPYRYFKFTNTGDEPLVISNARGSCGCTVPTYPTDPIMPGEAAEIKVRYATNRIGKFTKYITLTTNEAEPTRKISIKGEVLPKAEEENVPTEQNMFNGNGGF